MKALAQRVSAVDGDYTLEKLSTGGFALHDSGNYPRIFHFKHNDAIDAITTRIATPA